MSFSDGQIVTTLATLCFSASLLIPIPGQAASSSVEKICPNAADGRQLVIFEPKRMTIASNAHCEAYSRDLELISVPKVERTNGQVKAARLVIREIPNLCHPRTQRRIKTQNYGWLNTGETLANVAPLTPDVDFSLRISIDGPPRHQPLPPQLWPGFADSWDRLEAGPNCRIALLRNAPRTYAQITTYTQPLLDCAADGSGYAVKTEEISRTDQMSEPRLTHYIVKTGAGRVLDLSVDDMKTWAESTHSTCDWKIVPRVPMK